MKNCGSKLVLALLLLVFVFAGSCLVPAKVYAMKLNKTAVVTTDTHKYIRLRVQGTKRKVKWCSFDEKVAEVDSKGLVRIRKKGNAVIRARVGARKMYCIVSVVSEGAYLAVKQAKKYYRARNMHYSQGNRMGKTSADCSSYCGRCYLTQGMTLGGSYKWCNTAAGMAEYTSKHHQVVSNGKPSVSSKILLPGDLVFYRKGHNGRYKNIYHVEIFTGYGWKGKHLVGYTMSSITGHYPSILKRDYMSRRSRVCQVSRPAK